jgi:hypothetical protein
MGERALQCDGVGVNSAPPIFGLIDIKSRVEHPPSISTNGARRPDQEYPLKQR